MQPQQANEIKSNRLRLILFVSRRLLSENHLRYPQVAHGRAFSD